MKSGLIRMLDFKTPTNPVHGAKQAGVVIGKAAKRVPLQYWEAGGQTQAWVHFKEQLDIAGDITRLKPVLREIFKPVQRAKKVTLWVFRPTRT